MLDKEIQMLILNHLEKTGKHDIDYHILGVGQTSYGLLALPLEPLS